MTDVMVPSLGESVSEATVSTWFKKVGDTVKQDEMLCELETDKVSVEVPSPVSGVLTEILAPEGAVRGVWEEADGKDVSAQVYDLVTQWGGSISAEHGIGQMKVEELARLHDPVALALMAQVKAALDPGNLLNPGKLLLSPPEREAARLARTAAKA